MYYLVIEDLSFSCALHGNLIPYQTLSQISGDTLNSFNAVSSILAFMQSIIIDDLISMSCDDGHSGNMLLSQLSSVLFNIFAKNEANNMNSAIYKSKKRGHINKRRSSAAKKIQGNTSIIIMQLSREK